MNVAALLGLVELSGTLVLDKNGKIVLLPEGIEARPGDVELSPDNLVPDVQLREALFAQNFGEQNFGEQSGDDSSLSLAFGDEQDAADIIAQIEAGEDPTQNEDQATAAGGELSSSITDAATVEATQVQILAETLFETIGLDRQALSPTQTNTLVDIFINSAPVTIFDARTFDEESTDGELGLTFPSDVDGNSVIVTITELPVLGQITLADGTPVTLGQTLTQQEFESLQFDAPEEYTLGDDAGQFTYSADDGQGQENSVQEGGVLLTINPVNDIPVIDDVGDGTLVEAGNLDGGQVVEGVNTATGTIVARDNDTDSVLTYGVQSDTNEYGQLSVDPQTGEWIFTLDNRSSATQSLKEGESVETEFEITVTDDKGAVVTETLTLTINGTNDLPTFDAGGDAAGTVTEQGDGIGSDNIALGTLSVTDVDDDASLTFQVESAQTEYGSFSIDENGKWQFDLDNDASVTQALADGESKTINYTVSVTDEFGAKSEEVVSITIIGTNDTPEIKDPRGTTGAVSEAGNRDDGTVVPGKDTDTGIIRASDSDGTLSFTTSDTSPYGTFAVEESTGVWRFTLDNTSTESQALKEGQTVEAVFNVKVADETGAFVIQPITIEIFGTNDQPTIASSSELSSTVVESGENVDGTPSASGTLVGEDVDADATLTFYVEDGASDYGQFVLKPNGEWTFELDNNSATTQALNAGDIVDITYQVIVRDEFGAENTETLTITIVGTNDAPSIVGTSFGQVTEDNIDDIDADTNQLTVGDTLTVTDVDDGEAKFQSEVVGGDGNFTNGELTIDEVGNWVFTIPNEDAQVQALGAGEIAKQTFTVKTVDGTEHTITVDIIGTNDVPVLVTGADDEGTVTEDDTLTTLSDSGKLTIDDVDGADEEVFQTDPTTFTSVSTVAGGENGAVGTLTLLEDGSWIYDIANSAVEYLSTGDTATETFTVLSADGTSFDIVITINGTNDAPVIADSSELAGTVVEAGHLDAGAVVDGTFAISGQLVTSDVDLADGEVLDFSVANDSNPYGSVSIDQNGLWTFELDNDADATQKLEEGETATVTFDVVVTDDKNLSSTKEVTITIQGTNDKPYLTEGSTVVDSVREIGHGESGDQLAEGQINAADYDLADNAALSFAFDSGNTTTSVENAYGTFNINADGSWTFTLDNTKPATQALEAGESVTVDINAYIIDDRDAYISQNLTVTINGTNDAPVIANTSEITGTVVEAGHEDAGDTVAGTPTIDGQIFASDVDLAEGDVLDYSIENDANPYGSVSIDQNGLWTFELDNTSAATQALEEGDSVEVTFDVVVTDDQNVTATQTVTITVQGTNDKPYLTTGGIFTDSVTEAGFNETGNQLAEGQINAADYDLADGQQLSFAFDSSNTTTSVENAYGTFNINADGSWTFTLDNTKPATQALEAGESVTVDINAYIIDDRDAYISQNLTVTINGTNDAPVIADTSETMGTVTEAGHEDAGDTVAGTPIIDGQIFASDVDIADGDVLDYSIENDANPYGSVSIDQNGLWTFELDNTSAATQALEEGESATVTFDVVVTDDQNVTATQTVTITVEGTNDKPYLTTGGIFADSVTESGFNEVGDQLAEGQINAADYDLADNTALSFAFDSSNTTTSVENAYGTFNINADGSWTFTLDNTKPATQALEAGESVTVDINAYIIDDRDAYISQNLTVTINGTNDAPVIANTSEITGTVVEAGHEDAGDTVAGTPIIDGQIFASDVDLAAGDVLDYSIENDANPYGSVTIDQNGLWTFELDNGAAATQALEEGESATVTFDVVVTDDQNVTATQTVTITVEGTNDKPYLTTGGIFTDSVTEAGFNEAGDQLAEGQINAADYDLADNADLNFAFDSGNTTTSVENAYGTFNINADGSWTFTLDNTKPATQALEAGESVTVDINAYIIDDRDAYISQNLTVTINGTNDAPVIANTSEITGTVVEAGHEDAGDTVAGTPIIDGQIFASDVDLAEGDVLDYSIENDANPYGSVTIDQNGLWTFELDNGAAATQALEEGESATVTFDVVVTDDQNVTATQTVTITVEGTNDKPYLTTGGIFTDSVTEAGFNEAGDQLAEGQINAADYDLADNADLNFAFDSGNTTTSVENAYGTFNINADGSWTFTLDNTKPATQALEAGESVTVDINAYIIDDRDAYISQNLTVTINGTNDAPVIANTSEITGTVVEAGHEDAGDTVAGTPTIDGQIFASDVDLAEGDVLDYSVVNDSNPYGSVSIDQNGLWTFELDNTSGATQALEEGDSVEVTFDVVVTDDQNVTATQTVTITVEGTNDKPYLTTGGIFADSVTEAGFNETGEQLAEGQINAADYDLADGQPLSFAFDSGNTTTSVENDYGTFNINADGSWSFTLDNTKPATQALEAGESVTVDINAYIIDDRDAYISQNLTVTINGTNDAPVIANTSEIEGTVVEAGHEDAGDTVAGTPTIDGQIFASDVDLAEGDVLDYSVVNDSNPYGSVSIDQNGLWTFELDNTSAATQALEEGESATVTFDVVVTDDQNVTATQTVTIMVEGTNDKPYLTTGGIFTDSVTESGFNEAGDQLAEGQINAEDYDLADNNDLSFAFDSGNTTTSVENAYGTFNINADGSWTFTLDNTKPATQALEASESVTVDINAYIIDDRDAYISQNLTVTINGTNDAPVIANTSEIAGTVVEAGHEDAGDTVAGTPTIDGQIFASDVDLAEGDVLDYSIENDANPYGTVSIDQNGLWTFELDNGAAATQALEEGESATVTFDVVVTDDQNVTATQTVTITVEGTNDKPYLTTGGIFADSVTESGFNVAGDQLAEGQINASDYDLADNADLSFAFDSSNTTTSVENAYGTFNINADGSWTFTLDNTKPATQALEAGESVTVDINAYIIDDRDAYISQNLTVTINGTNDAPVIADTSEIEGTVVEAGHEDAGDTVAGTPTIDGQIFASDVDLAEGDVLDYSIENDANPYGSVSIDQNGLWTFELDNTSGATQALEEGDSVEVTFDVVVTDDQNVTATQTVTITVEGTNDKPYLTTGGIFADSVTEAGFNETGEQLAEGQINAADYDLPDNADLNFAFDSGNTTTSVENAYGTFNINADGSWTFTLDNTKPATQALEAGESVNVDINAYIIDDRDAYISQNLTVTINGTNDAPVIANTSEIAGTVVEAGHEDAGDTVAGTPTIDGQIFASDVDLAEGDVLDYSIENDSNPYGTVSIDQNGLWTFELDNGAAATQALEEGDSVEVTFDVVVTDDQNVTATQTVTITVEGTNDKPYLTTGGIFADSVTEVGFNEAGDQLAEGQINAADYDLADNTDLSFAFDSDNTSTSVENDYGTFNINGDGSWTFTLDNTKPATQALREGESTTVDIDAFIIDDRDAYISQTLTVTINGTNDQPTISGTNTGDVIEDRNVIREDGVRYIKSEGSLRVDDVDTGESVFNTTVEPQGSPLGTLTINAQGDWDYEVNTRERAIQQLGLDETMQESFRVYSVDGTSFETITITITGTNDRPRIRGNSTGDVTENAEGDDSTVTATGDLNPRDVDVTDVHTWSVVGSSEGQYGSFTINATTGTWEYTLDNAKADSLSQDQLVTETFTVQVDDGNGGTRTQNVTIDVTGTNDALVLSGDDSATLVEDLDVTESGVIDVDDIDINDTFQYRVVDPQGHLGSLSIDQNGKWTYTLDQSLSDHLEQGVSYEAGQTGGEKIFEVEVTDGTATKVFEVRIDVIGTNDAPDIGGTRTGVLYEVDGYGQTVGADLSTQDPDENETESWVINDSNAGVGTYGTLTLDPATGEWLYTLGVSDGQKASVDGLAHDSVVTEAFSVSVTDKYNAVSTKTITITVNGDNDRPVIGGTLSGEVTEDVHPDNDTANPITATGTLTDGDVDIGDDHTWFINSTKGQYGSISIDPQTGEWVYTLNNSNPTVQGLKGINAETLTDTFTVTVRDDSGASDNTATQTITVTIKGTNDAPEVKGETTGSVIEASTGRSTATGDLSVSDVDTTDSHTWAVENEDSGTGQATGTYGYMSVDDNGKWTYQLQSDWDATREIPPGESRTDTFDIIVTDEGGLTDTITVTVTVAGTNTDPEIAVKPEYNVIEDGDVLSGTIIAGVPTQNDLDNNVIGAGDPDLSEVVSWSVLDEGQYGTFSIDESTGTWQYVLNNNLNAVDSLDKGDTLDDTVRIRVLDKFGHESIQDINIEIIGENDAPNIRGAQTRTISEDTIEAGNYTATGQLNPGDVDADDTHQWEISDSNGGRGDYGSLILSSDGRWTFTYDQTDKLDDIKALKPGERLTDTFEVTVTDSHGATSTELVTIRIEGQNDAPTVSGDISGTYVEDNGTDDPSDDLTPITGRAILTDVDNDDFAEFVITDGQTENVYTGLYGDLSIDKDGNWQFTPKNDVMQSLNEDEVKQEVFTVIAQDQNGATITQDITISIEGRNDVPVITGESTGTVVEDGTADVFGVDLTRTDGQLVASDVDNDSSISGWSIETSGVGTYGTLTVDNNGKWTYVIDNSLPATQALISGETVQETFYVVATDNDGGVSNRQEVVIDVIGQQDPGDGSGGGGIIPVDISQLEVTEDGQLVDGDSYIFDVPAAARFVPINGGLYGELVRTPDGNWQYELDNDSPLVQGLDAGDTATENWRIILGPFYINVDVTINGTADKPEITYGSDTTSPQNDTILLGEALEDVTDSISGVLGVDDADLSDTNEWAVENGQGSYGTLVVDSETGEWTYVLDPSVELPAGEEVFDTFFVTVTDTDPNEDPSTASDRREVKVKIVGSAEDVVVDEKIIVETVTANEDNDDSNETGTGDSAIVITSADAGGPLELDPSIELGDQITWTLIDGSGTYGNIVVNQDGSWVFTLDNDSQAVQSLQEGETRQDVFEVYAVDQYGKTIVDENGLPQTLEIVVNVNGQNDAPTLQANVEETIVADDPDQTISGQLTVSDVDTQDQGLHTWAATPDGNVNTDYGTLTFNSDGSWSYVVDPNNSDVIALAANESIAQSWEVTVTDPSGLTDTQTLTINIQGENQPPTMSTVDGAVTEDDLGGSGVVSVTKDIVLDDLDTNDTVTLTAANLNGTYGQFVVDPDTNTWIYELYNDAAHVQALGEGVSVTEEFTIRATDNFGGEVTQTVEVTVTGSNDRPTLSGAVTGSVSDSLGSTASGKVTVADIDVGDSHSFSVKQDSDLGNFTIDNNGNWTFEVDPNNAEINALAKGQTKTIQVSVVATDDSGVVATNDSNEHLISITIVGTNDAPQIVDIGQQMATENIDTQLSGTFDDGDVDTVNIADDHEWEVVSGDPRGELSVDPTTGAWTFELTGDFEYLSEGETLPAPLTYEVKVTDEHGASDIITVEFQVTGTNDAPQVVAGDTVAIGTVYEDPTGTESGTATGEVKIYDADQSDTHSFSLSDSGMVTEVVGTYGTLKLIAGDTADTVKWEYVIDQSKADSLNDGPVNESFDLYIESLVGGVSQGDAITQTINVTVQGRNDAAIVSSDSQTRDETDAALEITGNLDSTDVDNPDDTFTVQNDVQGTYGTFSIESDGKWTFTASESYDYLNVGQSVSETFQVTTIDGTQTSVTVKIEGTNDAAQVSVGSVITDETDAALTITDSLTSSDVDNPNNAFTPSSETGTYGSFSIAADGVWTFIANQSFDYLNVGDNVSETFDVTSVDGTPSTVTVQINGTNDAATISAAAEELTESNSVLTTGGTLTASDPDNLDNVFVAQASTTGTLGTFTLSASGVWTFEANSAYDNLADGERVEESFDVFSIDGTKSQVTIGITGTNDAATVDSADVSLQETNAALTTGGTLKSVDVDNDDDTFIAQTGINGSHGQFSIDEDGVWTYVANEAFNNLNSGDSVSDTFIVKSIDGTESSVKVTINGTNDAATISAVDQVLDETDLALSTGGTLTSSDPDNLDNKFISQSSVAGDHGVFTIDEDGAWSYVADSTYDNLNDGDSLVDSFDVQSIDGTVSTVKVTIEGTNDAATVSSAAVRLIETDAVLSTSGTLTASDVDNLDDQFIAQTDTDGTYGTFSITVEGNWSFVANDALNSLADGEEVVESFNVQSIDGTTSTVTITIEGTNDAPTITGDVAEGVQEGVTDSVTGTVAVADLDNTATRSVRGGSLVGDVYSVTGTYGTFTFNIASGVWAYVLLAGSSNALAAGETDTDTFTILANDGFGEVEQPITITVTGNQGLRGDTAFDDILVATSDDEWMFGNSIPVGGGISSDTDSQDIFRWETANLAGTDTIKDFDVRGFTSSDPNIKHDVVDLTAVAFKDDQLLTDQLSVSEQDGNTVFEISDNGVVVQSIVLEGIALHTLLGVTPSEISDFTPTELLVALYQSEQLTLPDQIKVGTDSVTTETIVGTDDSDILFGGGGNDILTGGDGHDLFLFTEDAAGTTADPAEQTVTDFSVGSDILDISDLLPAHDNIGDLLGNITVSVTDDPADATDNATTVISVTNNGEQTDITLEGIGWNELGISDASVISDPGNHQTELLNQLDTMNVIKIDP